MIEIHLLVMQSNLMMVQTVSETLFLVLEADFMLLAAGLWPWLWKSETLWWVFLSEESELINA